MPFGPPLASPARRPTVIRSFRSDGPGGPAADPGAALPVTLGVIAAALALLVPAGVRGVPEPSPRAAGPVAHHAVAVARPAARDLDPRRGTFSGVSQDAR